MSRILCSTGALISRANNRDYRLLKDIAGQLNCDGFEFMVYSSWYDQVPQLLDFLCSLSLHIPVVHAEKRIGEAIGSGEFRQAADAFALNCDIAHTLGAEKIVLHLWNGKISDQHFENNLKAYPQLRSIADSCGVQLLIENVVCNQKDPFSRMHELTSAYPDICFVFDTKMAAFHGQLETLYEKESAPLWQRGQIAHYHINDYGGAPMQWEMLRTEPIGAGKIDFDKFFSFVRQTGYDGTFTVEASAVRPDGSIDTELLNRQFAFIRNRQRRKTL